MLTFGQRIIERLRRFNQSIRAERDIKGTPSNERLLELAANNPPPPEWLDGDEEDLF